MPSRWVAAALRRAACALVGLAMALTISPAEAHKVNVFAVVEGRTIQGEAYFRGGEPVRGVPVAAFDSAGTKLAETTTGDDGKFSLPIAYRCDYRLQVDAGAGHVGEYTVPAAELPADLPARDGAAPPAADPAATEAPAEAPPEASSASSLAAEVQALRTQVVEFRRQLDEFKNETRLRDVLGGVGYIVGAMGLAMYLAARRKRPAP